MDRGNGRMDRLKKFIACWNIEDADIMFQVFRAQVLFNTVQKYIYNKMVNIFITENAEMKEK